MIQITIKITNESLIESYKETNNVDLLEQIIKKNEGLIFHVMKRFRVDEVEREDLFQEGVIGIMLAIGKFDSSMNCLFSTFVFWHIRQTMRRYLDQKTFKHDKVDSLNKPVIDNEQIELIDLIQDESLNIEELIKTKLENEELQNVIKERCSELEQKAIHLYYYLNLTYKQIKETLQLSNVERARTLISKALRNIRMSKWYMRENREIRERNVDSRTSWVATQRYDSIGTGNSHRPVYSSVEDLVLERERIRQKYSYGN